MAAVCRSEDLFAGQGELISVSDVPLKASHNLLSRVSTSPGLN